MNQPTEEDRDAHFENQKRIFETIEFHGSMTIGRIQPPETMKALEALKHRGLIVSKPCKTIKDVVVWRVAPLSKLEQKVVNRLQNRTRFSTDAKTSKRELLTCLLLQAKGILHSSVVNQRYHLINWELSNNLTAKNLI